MRNASKSLSARARGEASHRRSIEEQTTRPMKNEDGWVCAVDRRRKNLDIDFLFAANKVLMMFFNVAARVNYCHWIDREKITSRIERELDNE
jgi:hypothetical protein